MTGVAISLVLAAALIHASWNYLLKKSGGGVGFVWAFAVLSSLLYAPLAIGAIVIQHFQFSAEAFAYLLASALLHTGYYLLLDRGYRYGDLSVVYPLARATGPASRCSSRSSHWVSGPALSPCAARPWWWAGLSFSPRARPSCARREPRAESPSRC
jgi:hypothetical protein